MRNDCPHFWLIQEVKGPVSRATCKLCHAHGTFGNYAQADTYRNYPEAKGITPFTARSPSKPSPSGAYYGAI